MDSERIPSYRLHHIDHGEQPDHSYRDEIVLRVDGITVAWWACDTKTYVYSCAARYRSIATTLLGSDPCVVGGAEPTAAAPSDALRDVHRSIRVLEEEFPVRNMPAASEALERRAKAIGMRLALDMLGLPGPEAQP